MEIYLIFEVKDNVYHNSDNTYGYDNDLLLGVYDSYDKALKVKEQMSILNLRIEKVKLNSML